MNLNDEDLEDYCSVMKISHVIMRIVLAHEYAGKDIYEGAIRIDIMSSFGTVLQVGKFLHFTGEYRLKNEATKQKILEAERRQIILRRKLRIPVFLDREVRNA